MGVAHTRAKVVAVAKTTHKFIVYCHASLIALLTAQPIYAISIARTKIRTTVPLYRLLGVFVEYSATRKFNSQSIKEVKHTTMSRDINKQKIQSAVRDILVAIGENPDREGLKDTPDRVARMLEEITAGYDESVAGHLSKTFEESGSAIVVERDIDFSSTCEHHLMPFFGKVHIAYVPNGKVVGLSKLARVVDVFAKRLQLQERLNAQIADAIYQELAPKGVIVVIEAQHTCMTVRGVKKVGSNTFTCAVRGEIDDAVKAMMLGGVQ